MKLSEALFLVAVLSILSAFTIPGLDRLGESSRRSVDASNIRQIGQASLIYANDHRDWLPPRIGLDHDGEWDRQSEDLTPSIHALAGALARHGGLNDGQIWISMADANVSNARDVRAILDRPGVQMNQYFAQSELSVQYVAGLHALMPSTTPIAVTRGLDVDGDWVTDPRIRVYEHGFGFLVYLGGNVRAHPERTWWERWRGRKTFLELNNTHGNPTHNVLETITADQAIYSSPPTPTATVDGLPGTGKPWRESTRRW